MNISRPSRRFWYWLRSYYLRCAPEPEAYLRFQVKAYLDEPSIQTEVQDGNFIGSLGGAVTTSLSVFLIWVFFVCMGPYWTWDVPDQAAEYAGTLWQVQAALLSIGFVVIVLLMQILGGRDRLDGTLFGEYVRRSFILPVAFLGLSTIAVMGATDLAQSYEILNERTVAQSTVANFSLLILNLFGIGYVYQRIVHLIRPGHGVDIISSLLKSSLQSSLHQQILNALAERTLNQKAGKYGFDYSSSLPRQGNPTEVEYPTGKKSLQVVDVDLNKLRSLSKSLERLNYTGPKGWVRARPGSTLSPSDSVIGYLQAEPSDFAQDSLVECYVVEENDKGRDKWEESVKNLRSRATRAIEERKPSELSEFLDVYEEVLRHHARYIGEYNSEVITAAFGGLMSRYWKPDSVLRREIRNLGRRAILADDRDLVEDILYLPIKVIRTARTKDRLELFESFAKLYLSFYECAQNLPADSTSREYILDRCWRHLKDFADWVAFKSFDRVDRPLDIIQDAPYAAKVLEMFSELIKRTLNHQDYDSFHTFSEKFDDLLSDLPSTRTRLRSERLRVERETDGEAEKTSEARHVAQALSEAEKVIDELLDLKSVARFGLAAWILDLYYRRGKFELDLAQSLIAKPASHFTDLEDFHDIYLEAREKEGEEGFNWTTWDMERHDEGFEEIRTVTTRTWLRRFYVVKGLELADPERIEGIDLSPSMQLRVEYDNIQSYCERILENGHPLRDFENLDERIDAFLELLEEAKDRQERLEADQLIEADVTKDRIEGFREGFCEGWREKNLDRLIEPFISVEGISEKESEVESVPFHLRRPMNKNQFTDATPVDVVPRSGKRLGRGLGRAERTRFFQRLRSSVPTEVVPEEKFAERLEEKARNLGPDLLLAGNRVIANKLRDADEYVPDWMDENHPHSDLPGYEGRLGSVPICTIPEGTDSVIAVSFSDSVQVKRVQQDDGEVLQVEIEEIDDEKAEYLLNENPNLGDDFESETEAIRHLKQHVLLDVSERINFEFGENGNGFELIIG